MKILTLVALEEETQSLFSEHSVTYTGVGKVNASYHITKAIYNQKPDIIFNIGTAGSKVFNYGEIALCNKFIQRDMNATAFGYKTFETPSEDTPRILEWGFNLQKLQEMALIHKNLAKADGICGTGDSFVTDISGNEEFTVVDMEAYAIAKIAKMENIPFICLKFISDGADGNAPQNWNDSLSIGAQKMFEVYQEIIDVINC